MFLLLRVWGPFYSLVSCDLFTAVLSHVGLLPSPPAGQVTRAQLNPSRAPSTYSSALPFPGALTLPPSPPSCSALCSSAFQEAS